MKAMPWTKPEMVEIKMDAEISSYQADDDDPRRDGPPRIARVASAAEAGLGERSLGGAADGRADALLA